MAVVTRGSFDEGPITLALPPVFEFAAAEEVDPIFSAWDKSTGIVINTAQINDIDDYVRHDELTGGTVDLSGYVTDQELIDAIGSNNTDLDNYLGTTFVPYSGANANVNLGTNTLTGERVYANQEIPISSLELVTKAYADDLAFTGAGGISPTVAHNDTTGKEGGGGGHWYHLSSAQQPVIDIITDTDTATTPSGLAVSSKGIITGSDGTQTAYVILTWTATGYGSFDHYVVEYQKNGNLGWVPVIAYSNTVQIEGLVPGVTYNFRVYSVNKYGTRSIESGSISSTMDSDTQAPGVTTVNSASGGIQMILIEWTHNTATDLAYYNLYRNTTNDTGTAVLKGNTKSNRYTDAPLPISTTYYYWVKAVDTSGNECPTFSTEVHATTKAVESADITSISATKVLITGTTYLSNWTGTDSTKIDGAEIETGTVSLNKLVFTTGIGYGLVAAINAYEDGIQISASNINIVGATLFAGKASGNVGSLSKVYIYPDSTRGLRITDDVGADVFLAEIGGTNIGDVTIGDWANNQGIKYDKSAHSLIVRGNIYAYGGAFSGITSFLTSAESNIAISIHGGHIYENNWDNDEAFVNINYYGYNGGLSRFRNTLIGDGKGAGMFMTDGSDKAVYSFYPTLIRDTGFSTAGVPNADAILEIRSTDKGVLFPRMTTTQRTAMTKVAGMIVYDTDVKRFCGVIMNNLSQLEWWTFGMNTNLG